VGWDSPEKTERDLKSHIEYLLISQKPRCRFLLDRLGEESELSDAAHVYHHEGDHTGVVTNWVRHPAKSRSHDLPRDLSRDFMTPYAIT
jgi:hypothetical protein